MGRSKALLRRVARRKQERRQRRESRRQKKREAKSSREADSHSSDFTSTQTSRQSAVDIAMAGHNKQLKVRRSREAKLRRDQRQRDEERKEEPKESQEENAAARIVAQAAAEDLDTAEDIDPALTDSTPATSDPAARNQRWITRNRRKGKLEMRLAAQAAAIAHGAPKGPEPALNILTAKTHTLPVDLSHPMFAASDTGPASDNEVEGDEDNIDLEDDAEGFAATSPGTVPWFADPGPNMTLAIRGRDPSLRSVKG